MAQKRKKNKGNLANLTGKKFEKGHMPHNTSVQTFLMKQGFTKTVVNEKIAEILCCNRSETNKTKMNAGTSNFELIVISIIEAAIRNADSSRLDNLLEKIFGKTIRVEGNINVDSTNQNLNFNSDDAELMSRAIERAIKKKEKADD